MSKETMDDVWAPIEANHKRIVMTNTWGHLFPTETHYEGTIRIAYSVYGHITILDEQIDIASSPWWFEAVNEFACGMSDTMDNGDVIECKISVDIINHRDPWECNDPEFPEEHGFDEYSTIDINVVDTKRIVVAY